MSGVIVIRYLLANNAPVLAVVPAARIVAGDLALNMALPAIAIEHVSGVPHNLIRTNEPQKLHTDRVQVSALFKGASGTPPGTGYAGVKALLKLILAACPSQYGVINGINVLSIQPEIEGPDLSDAATSLYSGSRDFIVSFTA